MSISASLDATDVWSLLGSDLFTQTIVWTTLSLVLLALFLLESDASKDRRRLVDRLDALADRADRERETLKKAAPQSKPALSEKKKVARTSSAPLPPPPPALSKQRAPSPPPELVASSTLPSSSTPASDSAREVSNHDNANSISADPSLKPSGYFTFDPDINVTARPGRELPSNQALLKELRARVLKELPGCTDEWALSEAALWRYLVARNLDVEGAKKQVIDTIKWREFRDVANVRAAHVEHEGVTGKCRISRKDKHGRPIIVLDSTKENTHSPQGNLQFLAYTLDSALRIMDPPVEKFVVVVRLSEVGIWSFKDLPGMTQTKETAKLLMTVFAERMGHCVVLQPPKIFTAFLSLIKPMLDAHLLSKVVWISGDIKDGSKNDLTMRALIGDDWKERCGVGQPVFKKGCTPGYDHDVEWPIVLKRDAEFFEPLPEGKLQRPAAAKA